MSRIIFNAGATIIFMISSAYGADIYTAIDSGSVAQVMDYIEQNPQLLNQKNSDGLTPLNLAAYRGHAEIVEKLLDTGADPDIGDNENSRPIHNAAVGGNNGVIEVLLKHGLEIAVMDNNGMTALMFAISYSHFETANYLLDKGADTKLANNNGWTALHYAVQQEQAELAKRLIESGTDLNAQTFEGKAPLHFTVMRNQLEIADMLLRSGADIEIKEDYGRTPLLMTTRESGSAEMAKLLIQHGANVDAADRFGSTPLELSAWRGFGGIVNLLLDNNASVPTTGYLGMALTRFACDKGLTRLFNILTEKGADLTIRSWEGGSLLHGAAGGGSAEIISGLIERGLAVNEVDPFGWMPLHYAAYKGRSEAMEILVSKGADVDARTPSGNSAYNLADERDRSEIKNLLIQHGADAGPRQFPELSGPYLGQTPPGDTPELFAPDIVSTNRGEHSAIAFSPDGDEAFWSSTFMPNDSGYAVGALMCSRSIDGQWMPPFFPAFTVPLETRDDVPFYAFDGQKLYFMSRRPLQPGHQGGKENIWIAEKTAGGWGDLYPAPGKVNEMEMHWQFSLTDDGTIYFPGKHASGYGMDDIYKSELVDGEYTAPQNLGPEINTAGNETCPYIAADGSYLIFASSGWKENDPEIYIYICYKTREGSWTEPIALGIAGLCPMISPDGKYLFYQGHYRGIGGIYWKKADFIDDLRPENL